MNFVLFTELPSPPSPSLCPCAGAASWSATHRAPCQTHPRRPWFRRNQPTWLLLRATRAPPSSAHVVRRLDVGAEPRVVVPLPLPPLKPSSPIHDANFDFPSSARHFPEPNPPLRRSERASLPTMVAAAPAPAKPPPPPPPNQTNPAAGYTSPPGSSPTPPRPRSLTGAPLPPRSTAAGRRRPWRARLRPSRAQPKPPRGSSRPPLAPPPRRRTVAWILVVEGGGPVP